MPEEKRYSHAQGEAPADKETRGLESRQDMRLARRSLKVLRGLCKEYHLSFRLPPGSAFGTKKVGRVMRAKPDEGKNSGTDWDDSDASSSSSGHSSFEFSSEDEKEGLSEHTKWPKIQEMLDGLQTTDRLKAIADVSQEMGKSAGRAEEFLAELDTLEERRKARESKGDALRITKFASAKAARAPAAGGEDSPGGSVQRRGAITSVDAADASGAPAGSGAAPAEEEDVVALDSLLRFNAMDMPVVDALRRCIDLVPELRKMSHKKEEIRKVALQKLQEKEERKRLQAQQEKDSDASDDTDPEEAGLAGNIERKLRQLGVLASDADPDLQAVLDAQKNEARALVLQIEEMEYEVLVKQHALEFVDGKLAPEGLDLQLASTAISRAQERKAIIFEEKRAQAEKAYQQELIMANVPTEGDVQAVLEETERLQYEVDKASDQIKRMDDLQQSDEAKEVEKNLEALANGEEDGGGGGTRRRGALKYVPEGAGAGCPSPLGLPLEKVDQIYADLQREKADMEEEVALEEQRVQRAEDVLKNAEKTLKVLEESKILLLEQVAREKPALVDFLLASEVQKGDTESSDSGPEDAEGEEEEEEEPEDGSAERLLQLSSEERWLRLQISEAEYNIMADEADDEEEEDEDDGEGDAEKGTEEEVGKATGAEAEAQPSVAPSISLHVQAQPSVAPSISLHVQGALSLHSQAEPEQDCELLVQDIQKLTHKVEAAVAREGLAGNSGDMGGSSDSEEDEAYKSVKNLSRQAATQKLQEMPHEQLRNLLCQREENEQMLARVTKAQKEVDRLRAECGACEDLLGEFGIPGAIPPPSATIPNQELIVEVQRKAKELMALRKRWWKERQDPGTTVRRALCTKDLPLVEGIPDTPPTEMMRKGLFDRIHETMTMP